MPSFEQHDNYSQRTQISELTFLRRNAAKLEPLADEMGGIYDSELAEAISSNIVKPKDMLEQIAQLRYSLPSPTATIAHFAWADLARMSGGERDYQKEQAAAKKVLGLIMPKSRVHYDPKTTLFEASFYMQEEPNACPDAEEYFVQTAKQIETGEFMEQDKIVIYTDVNKRPIGVGKSFEHPSVLLTEPMKVGGVYIPRGVIAYFDPETTIDVTGWVGREDFEIATVEVGSDLRVMPIRYSAWSYDVPMDQAMYGVCRDSATGEARIDFHKIGLLQANGIDKFKQTASLAIELCADLSEFNPVEV
jgi:hypothetical protein